MSPSRLPFRKILLLSLSLILPVKSAFAQQVSDVKRNVPIELQAADPEIRALLEAAQEESDLGNAISKAKAAADMAQSKGFIGDKAISEAFVARGYAVSANLDEAFRFYQASFQDAVDSSNLILQADVLVTLSMLPGMQGNQQEEMDLLIKARTTAEQSKNLYIKSRVLGELGRQQIALGKRDEGIKSIDEALAIDRVNGYDFEPLHLIYATDAILSQSQPDLIKAISQLESARDLAVERQNYVAFVQAQNALGNIYIKDGQLAKAIATLESTRTGTTQKDGHPMVLPAAFRAAAERPVMRATLLEALGRAYGSAHETDKAFQAWNELYSLSQTPGFASVGGEAALELANIYRSRKDLPTALHYYATAADISRRYQLDWELPHALSLQAGLLIEMGKSEDAIPMQKEISELADRTHNRLYSFTANMVLADIYQRLNRFNEARIALEKSASLIKPGTGDSEIADKLTVDTYARLADVYKALNLPFKELMALEKLVAVLQILKNDQQLSQTLSYLKGRLEALQIEEQASKAAAEGRLVDSLCYSEILYLWNGDATGENWNRVMTVPFRIAQQPDGPQTLDSILSEMGPPLANPLLNFEKAAILQALSDHFTTSDIKPELAERYASEAEETVKQMQNPANVLLVNPVCNLAIAYAGQGKTELAKQKAAECMKLAQDVTDVSLKDLANRANTLAQIAANNQADAATSLQYFLKSQPNQPELHLQVAFAFIKQNYYQKAVAEFNQAIQLIEAKKDLNVEANAFARMAVALAPLTSTESKKQQLVYWKSAERLYTEINNSNLAATTEMEIGLYYVNAGDRTNALTYFQQAQALGEQAHDAQVSADAAALIGNVYSSMRNYEKAAEFEKHAAGINHELGNKSREAMTLNLLAGIIELQGHLDDALRTSLTSEALARESSDNLAEYEASTTLGNIYDTQGEFERAAAALNNALEAARRTGQPQNEASAELSLSEPYFILGQWDDARSLVEKALETFRAIGNKQGEASANVDLAEIYSDRTSSIHDYDKAMAYLSVARQLGYSQDVDATAIETEVYRQTGRYSDGIDAAKKALDACVKVHSEHCQAQALMSLAELQRDSGDIVDSLSSLKNARRLAANSKDFFLQGRLLYVEAGQQRAEGHLQQAIGSYERVISLLESIKGQGDLKIERSIAESYGFIYDELISALFTMSAKALDREKTRLGSVALQYTETNKAREFADSWGRTFISELRRKLPADLQEKERALIAKAAPTSSKDEWDSFINMLRRTQPQYAAVAYPEPVTLENLPLQRNETLVEFKMTDESTFVWIMGNRGDANPTQLLAFYEIAKPRQWFADKIALLRTGLNGEHRIDPSISEELFRQLFPGKFSEVLTKSETLTFIPDDKLFVLPFELFSPEASKGNFPFLNIPTRYYPSAAALRLARAAGHNANWQEAFLGLGDPITSPEDERYDIARVVGSSFAIGKSPAAAQPIAVDLDKIKSRGFPLDRLPATATEVRDIATLFQKTNQPAELRLGSDATKDRLLETDLTRFRYLHFATHGILPVDSNIKEPSLVLSFDGTVPEHMLLSMSEILGLRIKADTVVLSACNTGSGAISRAEGVMSLGRAFMAAGAESVTVSLWGVSDESTQILMEEYYRSLIAGKSKAEALAVARSLLFAKDKRFTNPFYWAPFVLIGD